MVTSAHKYLPNLSRKVFVCFRASETGPATAEKDIS